MNCIFNDLSFLEFVADSVPKLLSALKEIHRFHVLGCSYGHVAYIHRDGLYACTVCGKNFRQAINGYIKNPDEKRKIFSLLDKKKPVLPDDTVIPVDCRFFYEDREISCTGLAECAFRESMGDASLAYSLACAGYSKPVLRVVFEHEAARSTVDVPNFTSIDGFKNKLAKAVPEARCWEDILQRADRFSFVRIEASAKAALDREPFEVSLGKAVWKRLQILEEMAASSGTVYTELIKKHCHGENALFSDESESRINDLKDKLYFWVNGEKKRCSFHGKISHRSFRIHMDKQPVPGEIVYIAYIGYKIL